MDAADPATVRGARPPEGPGRPLRKEPAADPTDWADRPTGRYYRTYVRSTSPPSGRGYPGAGEAASGSAARAPPGPGSLALLAERTRPVSSSRTRLLPVAPPLGTLLPDGSLRRGTTVVVDGPGRTGTDRAADGSISVALALLAAASGAGSWCALVGLDGLGVVAAHELGIDLARLAVVPRPGAAWAEATATLIDGVDLVVLCPPFPPARPWPAGWSPGPGSAGPSWWSCRAGPGGPTLPTCA